jgi:hypothetical protein
MWDLGLRCKGIVLLGAGQPIVLCAVDWCGIGDESNDAFRRALAKAAGTIPERVAVHTLHQHDAPMVDFGGEKILIEAGFKPQGLDGSFAREVMLRLETAVRNSLDHIQPISHIGLGEAQVYKVASNRSIFGKDGKVRATRWTACTDSALRAEPEGLIDPIVSLVSLWNADKPVAVVSYYASHPQSYWGTFVTNPDIPGVARFFRQMAVPAALHIHFDGAGGNIGAGKYNDGSHENRLILAERLADGMKRAWEATKREPITVDQVAWTVVPVALPPAKFLEKMQARLKAAKDTLDSRKQHPNIINDDAQRLAWLKRCQAGTKIDVTCLTLGRARILHLPGELFVEYQLAAKAERPDLFVAMAAYGDYGPGYIGTAVAYQQGGYEVTEYASSNVAPEVEVVLMTAIKTLLQRRP